MPTNTTVKKLLAAGSAAIAAGGLFALSATAQLAGQNTSCEPFNSQWNVCTVYQWDADIGGWVPVDSFFQFVGEAATVE